MKLRIIEKCNNGFKPFFELQRQGWFGFWWMVNWSMNLDVLKENARILEHHGEYKKVIWTNEKN